MYSSCCFVKLTAACTQIYSLTETLFPDFTLQIIPPSKKPLDQPTRIRSRPRHRPSSTAACTTHPTASPPSNPHPRQLKIGIRAQQHISLLRRRWSSIWPWSLLRRWSPGRINAALRDGGVIAVTADCGGAGAFLDGFEGGGGFEVGVVVGFVGVAVSAGH